VFVARRKPIEHAEARRLRAEHGTPLKQIATRLGVSVSTAHVWTKDILLTPAQRERNASGPTGPQNPVQIRRRVEAIRRTARQRRREYQAEGRRKARLGDPLHQSGCMLYWAEGAKDRNTLGFVNSDRPMVEYFVRFLRESLGVTPEDITLRLNVYLTNGLSLGEVEDHWLGALGLPRASLRKHTINHAPTSSSGLRSDKLPYGVCAVRVKRSTRLVQHIYGAIQEYGGFEEPRWLDGPPRKPRPPRAAAPG
jgi:hypothetical protein